MGRIQDHITQHLNVENSFVKSIQAIGMSDDEEVVVPKGFNIRFINCKIKKLIAEDSALHLLSCKVDEYQLLNCILSIDGGSIEEKLTAKNCRLNLKELPEDLKTEDAPETKMKIAGSIKLTNCESFWNTVTFESKEDSEIENSRVEFSDCKLDLKSKLTVKGSDWYVLKGSLKTKKEIEIKEIDSEKDESSTNNVKGTAGVGPGSICHFKSLDSIELENDGFKINKSECNFSDIESIKSKQVLFTYTSSCGKISDCKNIEAKDPAIILETSGNVHIANSTIKACGIKVEGSGSNLTMTGGSIDSKCDAFTCTDGFIDLYSVDIKSEGNAIKATNSTIILYNCPNVEGRTNTFDATGSFIESNKSEKLKAGETIFKGENSTFVLRGNSTVLESGDKDIDGSGVFIAGAPEF